MNELVKSGVLTLDSFTNEHSRSQPAQFAQLIQLAKNLRREIQNRRCREITRKLSFPSACGIWIARIVAIVSFPTKIALVKSSSLSLVSSASMRAFFAAQTEAPSGGIGFSQLTVDSDPELG